MTVSVGRYFEPGIGEVNTYWIETADGIIVIDGQRELSKASRALAEIRRTGKPILAIFVTHPHPDHFGGIGVFAASAPNSPIYSSKQTRESIETDRFGLVKKSQEAIKDDFPEHVTLPNRELSDHEELVIGGVRIVTHELGPGEAECMTALHLPDEGLLFSGDALQDRATAYLLEGRSAAWLAQLERLRTQFSDVQLMYPGHGKPGSLSELVDRQVKYLTTFRQLVSAETASGAKPDEASAQRVVQAMEAQYPGYLPVAAIPDLLKMDVEPVAKEIVEEI